MNRTSKRAATRYEDGERTRYLVSVVRSAEATRPFYFFNITINKTKCIHSRDIMVVWQAGGWRVKGYASILVVSVMLTIVCIPSEVQASPLIGWGSSFSLDPSSTGEALEPQVAMNDYGDAVVTWLQIDGSYYDVYAKVYDDGVWGTATLLENLTGMASSPKAAIDNDGDALAVWVQDDGSYDNVYTARYSGGTWETAVIVDTKTGDADNPCVAMADNGDCDSGMVAERQLCRYLRQRLHIRGLEHLCGRHRHFRRRAIRLSRRRHGHKWQCHRRMAPGRFHG